MPEIVKLGDKVTRASRWPHGETCTCPSCGSTCRLTEWDTEDGTYKIGTTQVEVGAQWDSSKETRYKISFECPICGAHVFERVAPSYWTPDYARGGQKGERPSLRSQYRGYGLPTP